MIVKLKDNIVLREESYDYVALEKRLTKEQQEEVRKLGVVTNSYYGTKQSCGKRNIYFVIIMILCTK